MRVLHPAGSTYRWVRRWVYRWVRRGGLSARRCGRRAPGEPDYPGEVVVIADSGTYGTQPAKKIINFRSSSEIYPRDGRNGRIARTAGLLGEVVGHEVKAGTLQAWLDGRNLPPAEVKIGLAQVLGREVESLWTPGVLAATYVGPRGGARRAR